MSKKKSNAFGARKVAAKSLQEAMAEKGTDEGFDWGDALDIGLGIGAAALAIPSGGMSLAAVPAVIGTGMMAKQASQSIREGLEQGDLEKGLSGVSQAGGAYKGIQAANPKEPDYTGVFEGKTDEEIDKILEVEEQNRLLKL